MRNYPTTIMVLTVPFGVTDSEKKTDPRYAAIFSVKNISTVRLNSVKFLK